MFPRRFSKGSNRPYLSQTSHITVKPRALSLVVLAVAAQSASAVDRSWTQEQGDFNVGSNWNQPFDTAWLTGDRAAISNGGTATLSTGTATVLELWAGQNGNGTGVGTYSQTGGSLTATEGTVVGRQGTASGTISITGGTFTTRSLRVGGGPSLVASNGTVTISGSETVFNTGVGSVSAVVGIGAAGTGTVTLENGATWNASVSNVFVGGDNNSAGTSGTSSGGTGTLNIRNGASFKLAAVNLAIGRNGAASGTLNVTDGGSILITNNTTSDAIFNLGNVNGTSTIPAGTAPPVANVTLSGSTSAITVPRVLTGAGNVTFNLDGGTFTSRYFTKGSGNTTIHFNGTKLVAAADNGNYFANFPKESLDIKAGGLEFDTDDWMVILQQGFSGPGSFTKSGEGIIILQAPAGYTGDTIVTGGILSLNAENSLADGSKVSLSSGGILALDFSGADTVSGLVIDGVPQAAGVWGAEGSGSEYETPLITGTGQLQVSATQQGSFATWTSAKGLSGADALPGADPDGDGYSNLAEFILGGEPNPSNPAAHSDGLRPEISTTPGAHVFSFRRSQASANEPGLEVIYQHASDLSTWKNAVHGEDGISISTTPNGYGEGIDRVDVSIPNDLSSDGKRFVRLRGVLP